MHPILNIAIKAIRKGGNFIIQNYDTYKPVQHNTTHYYKLINKIIEYSEKTIENIIYKFYPKHSVIHQRLCNKSISKKNICWVINIMDGILNYSKLFPHFCITISVYNRGNIEISVIYDPLKNELFSSVKGQGSTLNGYRVRCGVHFNDVNNLIISTNFLKALNMTNWIMFNHILQKICLSNINVRCTGSLSLDLAYIAIDRLNCFIGYKKTNMSFSVGELYVKESGGVILDIPINIDTNKKHIITFIGSSKSIKYLSKTLNIN
ncbi:inositol-1-monophosphatase [Buchnera aphidicola (Nipponaphis monzeni)]|uniref:Inositol-1-monophosphatase n=1 Tax=Buchnera aphidicola (Nipponaphis monzeni) TaxID=2495405 RepID=A0A455TAA1_9GAMM|nr:inositol monophosphatase family protein [Buchnera aphidicola]BBI01235.1 inositol-1-monophosphatase [Buchnera aphidicola (Nipponaphis monzeni)]